MGKLGTDFEKNAVELPQGEFRKFHDFARALRAEMKQGRMSAQTAIDKMEELADKLKQLKDIKEVVEYRHAVRLGQTSESLAEVDTRIEQHARNNTVHYDHAIRVLEQVNNELGAVAFPNVRRRAAARFS